MPVISCHYDYFSITIYYLTIVLLISIEWKQKMLKNLTGIPTYFSSQNLYFSINIILPKWILTLHIILPHSSLGFKAFPMLLKILHWKYYFSWLPSILPYSYNHSFLLSYCVLGAYVLFPGFAIIKNIFVCHICALSLICSFWITFFFRINYWNWDYWVIWVTVISFKILHLWTPLFCTKYFEIFHADTRSLLI